MKDEIKEILEALKSQDKEFTKAGIKEYPLVLSVKEQKILLDYITNLQEEKSHLEGMIRLDNILLDNYKEENERLKEIVENLTTMTVCGDRKQIKNTAQYKLEIAQDRINKAIELISKEFLCYDNESDEYIQGKKAINILQGEDKDE